MVRDDCARAGCGHAKETHYPQATLVDGPKGQYRKVERFACLASFCTCDLYEKPEPPEPAP